MEVSKLDKKRDKKRDNFLKGSNVAACCDVIRQRNEYR